jgi:hypothetical protein
MLLIRPNNEQFFITTFPIQVRKSYKYQNNIKRYYINKIKLIYFYGGTIIEVKLVLNLPCHIVYKCFVFISWLMNVDDIFNKYDQK